MDHDVAYGGDTGDSYAEYMLVIETASTQLAVEMGGHLAIGGEPLLEGMAWGDGLGHRPSAAVLTISSWTGYSVPIGSAP